MHLYFAWIQLFLVALKNYFRKLTNVNWRSSRSCERFLFPFSNHSFYSSIISWEVPPGSSLYSPSSRLYDGPLLSNHPSWDDFLVLPCPSICPGEIDLMCSIVLTSFVIFVFLSALQEKVPTYRLAKQSLSWYMKWRFIGNCLFCLLLLQWFAYWL